MDNYILGFWSVYFLGRLFFYDEQYILGGRTLRKPLFIARLLWGATGFVFSPNVTLFMVFFAVHAFSVLVDSFLRSRVWVKNRWYYALHLTLAFTLWPGFLHFARIYLSKTPVWAPYHWLKSFHLQTYLIILVGFLLTQKEATIVIRLVLRKLRALPRQIPESRKKDQREYDLGRIIGMLERVFLYFLIIWQQIGAIAILIALKSLARYKELEDKHFAEYFLIGSLLSILTAVIPAVLVLLCLK
jgi:hypothetical protein